MLEAIFGGLVGALIGAAAGGWATYRVEKSLQGERRERDALNRLRRLLRQLHRDLRYVYDMGYVRYLRVTTEERIQALARAETLAQDVMDQAMDIGEDDIVFGIEDLQRNQHESRPDLFDKVERMHTRVRYLLSETAHEAYKEVMLDTGEYDSRKFGGIGTPRFRREAMDFIDDTLDWSHVTYRDEKLEQGEEDSA